MLGLPTAAVAATYDSKLLNAQSGACLGYGWGDSEYPYGVYAGTSITGGTGSPCYDQVQASVHYFGGTTNFSATGYQTYSVYQGAGPGSGSDWVSASHWLMLGGGGTDFDTIYAFD